MSIEEPKSATEPASVQDDELQTIDLDDVEGHGLKEVAAGLGAAAVLAGGGTAAMAATGVVHPSLPNLHPSTPSISHPIDQGDRATDWAIATSRDVRDGAIDAAANAAGGALSLTDREVSATSTLAGNLENSALRDAGAVTDIAGQAVQGEVKVAGQAVSGTEHVTVNTTKSATTTATTATNKTVSTSATTVNATARKAATVVQLTTSTVNALETTIVATVTNLNPEAGAGTSSSSGWVTFSLGGENIASVQLHNGQASVTVKTASLGGKVLQAVYSGDTIHAPSMRSITL